MSLPEGWVQNFGYAVSRQDGLTQAQYASPTPLALQPQWQPKAVNRRSKWTPIGIQF